MEARTALPLLRQPGRWHGRRCAALLLVIAGLPAAEFHVAAATGNDSTGDGSAGNPYATITRGLAAVVSGRGDTVTIHAGTYRETVRIEKSGQSAAVPLRLRAAPGATVVVSGLDPLGGWSAHSGSIYKASVTWSLEDGNADIDADKRDHVRDQLFVDGLPQIVARWPNVPVAEARRITSAHLAQIDQGSGKAGSPNYVSDTQAWFTDAALGSSGLSAATIAGSLITYLPGTKCFARTGRLSAWNGTTATVLAERLNAANASSANHFDGPFDFLHGGCDYHLWGKLAYLDAPGEWFRDPASDLLYARMPDSAAPSSHLVELRRRDYAITVDQPNSAGNHDWIEVSGLRVIGATIYVGKNCDGVVFRDLDCRYLTHLNDQRASNYLPRWSRLAIINGTGCSIVDSTFIGLEGGIELNGRTNALRNCVISDTGANGLAPAVSTNLGSESASNDGSVGQRNRIENCTFLGSSYSAIYLGPGTDVIANEVVTSHRQGSDLGALSAGPGVDTKNIEIAWNVIHDLYPQVIDGSDASTGGVGDFYGSHGIYFDRNAGAALIHHNLTWNTHAAGIALLTSPSARRIYANSVRGKMSVSAFATATEAKNNLADRLVDDGGGQRLNGSSPLIAGNLQYLGADPGWYAGASGDLRLRASSPAIDAGVALAAIPGTGFTGSFSGGAPDAGAYEGAAAWTRAPGAAVTPAQLAAVTVTITGSDGSLASANIGGLPVGRHLPADAAIRLGNAAAGGTFRNQLDPVTGIYTVTVTGIPVSGSGVQTVQLSGDGGATWLQRGTSSVDRLAITTISGGGSTGFRASGGETITISGHGYAAPAPATWTRTVAVANPSGVAVHGYPVRLSLDTATLIAAGKLQPDGRDLRVSTASDGELPLWIESGLNTAATALWVRVPRVPADGIALTLSYGDPARSAQSDPRQVFFWYEDFTGLSALPGAFAAPSSTTVGGGKAVVAGTTTNADAFATFGFGFNGSFVYPLDGPYLIESLITVASPTQSGWKGAFGSSDGTLGINSGQIAYYNGAWQNLAASTIAIGTPIRVGLAVDPAATALTWYEGEVARATRSAARPPSAWMIGPNGSPKGYRLEVDEIRIRPFRANGPTASVGGETAIPALGYTLTIDGVSVPVTRVDERTLTAITPPAPAGALPRQATVTLTRTNPGLSATGTITLITTPAAVGGVTATGGTRQIAVAWSAVPSAASYTVRWGPRGGALASSVSGLTTLAHTITGLADGTNHDVTVEAVNHVGTGAASNRVTAITIPAAPTGLAGVVGEGTVAITWTRPAGAATCTLRWGTVSGSYTGTLAGLTGGAASIAPLANGTPIHVVVSASNAAGTGPLSAELTITPQIATALPASAPGAVSAIASDARIDVAWSAVPGAGGYIVRWGPAGGTLTASATTTALSHIITGLTNGTAYDVTVEATNSLGAGPASARLTRTPLAGVAPPDPSAEPVIVSSGAGGGGGGRGCGIGLAVVALAALALAQAGSRRRLSAPLVGEPSAGG